MVVAVCQRCRQLRELPKPEPRPRQVPRKPWVGVKATNTMRVTQDLRNVRGSFVSFSEFHNNDS
jgi:hypothetical protein